MNTNVNSNVGSLGLEIRWGPVSPHLFVITMKMKQGVGLWEQINMSSRMSYKFFMMDMRGGNYRGMLWSRSGRTLSLDIDQNKVLVRPVSINNVSRAIMRLEGFPAEGCYLGADYRYKRKRKTMDIHIEINI